MSEKVKRLKPTPDTLRELYLKSGNKCAFTGCPQLMIDENGVFIGEVCHIEGAMPGGERFNKNQSNEDRRKFENLMLMCHKHHKITNDVYKYTVEKLREMKKNHERKFTDIETKIAESIKDYAKEDIISMPKTLNGMNEYFAWGQDQEELLETIKQINVFAENLKQLPHGTRAILAIVCERVEKEKIVGAIEFKVPASEIQKVSRIAFNDLKEHLAILIKYKMCYIEKDWDEIEKIYLNTGAYDGWWGDIKEYCINKNISLAEIITNLDFSMLD
ncbi:hypothetical protein CACET_c12560 [Clostridium aceticum]|uniref:Uncharacterized protein n=1 Tax=Clostridium aceticum TaxID=84022 RepID=A0A0D8IC52_9CLOT|nr:hypothetical protein [Clostridium aceticum]AKL94721.1 hypothetical protein CACET_c12560 [Clostridium aceticum]KJF27679.1 hypothetical protein TZ02_03415 [Clostridium aceticum]